MGAFDNKTAQPLPLGTIPGPHPVYRDANGALCLWADSPLRGGGVAVNADARDAFERLDGPKFYRLTNARARLDKVLPAEEVPFGDCQSGFKGLFFPVDLAPPPFTPVADSDKNGPFDQP